MALAKNDPDKAFELLKAFVDKPGAQPPDRNDRLYLAAAHLEKLAQQLTKPAEKPIAERFVSQAETFYRACVEKNAAHQPELVLFLARQGRIDEAIDLLDRTCGQGYARRARSHRLDDGAQKVDKDQSERLNRILQAAMKRADRPVPLLMAMADLCIRQSRNAEAEDLYREILQKNSDNTNAMTSLAVLLAQQGIKLDESLKLVESGNRDCRPYGDGPRRAGARLPGPWGNRQGAGRHRQRSGRKRVAAVALPPGTSLRSGRSSRGRRRRHAEGPAPAPRV